MKVDGLRARRRNIPAACLAAGILTLGASSWALQQRSEAVPFRPGAKGQPINLPRGEVLLFQFLQKLADATGEPVYLNDESLPDAKLILPRALSALDAKIAQEILSKEGLELTRESYRGKQVYWVQRPLVPPARKGKIVRDGEQGDEEPLPPRSTRPASDAGPSREASQLHFYRREDGTGARFLLLFETDSPKEAEEVRSLIRAHQRSKTSKQ